VAPKVLLKNKTPRAPAMMQCHVADSISAVVMCG
jgi:hypothetical protein